MSDERPTHLDLFSGIGGFALAAQWAGFRTIGFCEIDKYCQRVLAKNFLADTEAVRCGSVDDNGISSGKTESDGLSRESGRSSVPIIADIRDLDGRDFYGVTLITGGFPCQSFSVAGKRRGKEDDRYLWPEMLRVIKEARPNFVLAENVTGIVQMELDSVLSDLEGIGYATGTLLVPACAVDAKHRRMRVWVVGHSQQSRLQGHGNSQESDSKGWKNQSGHARPAGWSGNMADTAERRLQKSESQPRQPVQFGLASTERALAIDCCWWQSEPPVCKLADGLPAGLVRYAGRVGKRIPNRVHKLKALGNAIVPQCAYEILKVIRETV